MRIQRVRHRHHPAIISSSAVFVLGFLAPALLQAQQGGIRGTVSEEKGLRVPAAGVVLSGPALTEGRQTTTGSDGTFRFDGLPVGTYEIRISAIGFAPFTEGGVTVTAGQATSLSLVLEALRTVALEELRVVATGTHFEQPSIGLPYAVEVASREELQEQGLPLPVDFFKRLSVVQGSVGERNSWFNRSGSLIPESVATVNLRGLGASRTLVLLNGRRQVYAPARLIGGRPVDVNAFPTISIERIDVLKEGASAIYGSDAVAGVVNYVTRSDFEGFEVTAAHDYFSGGGDSNAGAIWGSSVGDDGHLVVSAEWARREALSIRERDWGLRDYPGPGGGGWSYYGNPGAFLMPTLRGDETPREFTDALIESHYGETASHFLDPDCGAFGGHPSGVTCRFRYAAWDNIVERQSHVRGFAEFNKGLGDDTHLHVEGLWAHAVTPGWLTTPSFPPIALYDGLQVVLPENPGRQAFCATRATETGFVSEADCLEDDWFFFGRMVGNKGPGRELRRESQTQRLAASLEHDFNGVGGLNRLDVAVGYSRAAGNVNQPAEYAYRKFLAYRGFGGPDCGVGVLRDPGVAAGMRLGPTGNARPGVGSCMYYNPFSNSIQRAQQPGTLYTDRDNPWFDAGVANSNELIDWINEEVDLSSTTELLTGEATLSGQIASGLGYALGYQARHIAVTGDPNDQGDLTLNPCPVPGDRTCLEQAGAYTFTTGFFPYTASQTVHRLYSEIPIDVGEWLDIQLAANYEAHDVASSFDPKVAARIRVSESDNYQLALRASFQSSFRVPSVDDVNTDKVTSLQYVQEGDVYKAVDSYGSRDLLPERAITRNVGLVLYHFPTRTNLTVDAWRYDFRDLIELIPHAAITRLYHEGGASRRAVQEFVRCPDGWGTGTCEARLIERMQNRVVNWPGMLTSGLDWSVSSSLPLAGGSSLAFGLNGTYTNSYNVEALEIGGVELVEAREGAGKLNRDHTLAWPLPTSKWTASVGYHTERLSVVGHYNYISSYDDPESADPDYRVIPSMGTIDATVIARLPNNLEAFMTAANVFDTPPPLVNWELSYDGFTHDPKGRRIKAGLTWRMP